MINIEILQDILTDHVLCPTQREELEKVIEKEIRYKEFMKMYTSIEMPQANNILKLTRRESK